MVRTPTDGQNGNRGVSSLGGMNTTGRASHIYTVATAHQTAVVVMEREQHKLGR